jgi:hypothetical protein
VAKELQLFALETQWQRSSTVCTVGTVQHQAGQARAGLFQSGANLIHFSNFRFSKHVSLQAEADSACSKRLTHARICCAAAAAYNPADF